MAVPCIAVEDHWQSHPSCAPATALDAEMNRDRACHRETGSPVKTEFPTGLEIEPRLARRALRFGQRRPKELRRGRVATTVCFESYLGKPGFRLCSMRKTVRFCAACGTPRMPKARGNSGQSLQLRSGRTSIVPIRRASSRRGLLPSPHGHQSDAKNRVGDERLGSWPFAGGRNIWSLGLRMTAATRLRRGSCQPFRTLSPHPQSLLSTFESTGTEGTARIPSHSVLGAPHTRISSAAKTWGGKCVTSSSIANRHDAATEISAREPELAQSHLRRPARRR